MATWRSLRRKFFYKFKPCLAHPSFILRPYHAVSIKSSTYCHRETYFQSRERTNPTGKRCVSGKPGKAEASIVVLGNPFQWISKKIKIFLVNSYFDADFEEETFIKGAKQAVVTVSALVTERKFNQLKGLLTDEAIEKLGDEVVTEDNIEAYRITMDDIIQTTIFDVGFQYDKTENGRKWLHIMVSCICQGMKIGIEEQHSNTFIRSSLPRITRYSFCKECTSGIDDGWIITQMINITPKKEIHFKKRSP
ncbi:m-AAA protease-interacting protein 1, mitochondrial-like [Dendronephthya gigantea]|uniref:m-AAA protease-interacting protein 1, mitochondrial-like n=1 Tax=Dendronephthya gigantea TaxID=151771 RepID=UPI00106A62F1|nr:m-AAA protease-interacting protein 1, mitochondrial-like [Dendronephthya gigantea]